MQLSQRSGVPPENFSTDRIRQVIENNIDLVFSTELLSNALMKKYVLRECTHPLKEFSDLMTLYLGSPKAEGYEQIVKLFLELYERFTEAYTSVLKRNGFNRPICAGVAIIWLRVIEYAELEARLSGDMLLRNIAMQLDMDMMNIIEKLFPLPDQ